LTEQSTLNGENSRFEMTLLRLNQEKTTAQLAWKSLKKQGKSLVNEILIKKINYLDLNISKTRYLELLKEKTIIENNLALLKQQEDQNQIEVKQVET
jgi:hypothetical protein